VKYFPSAPTWGLVFGAATWGVVWYPYRLLNKAGVDGIWSTVFTYGIALVAGVILFPKAVKSLARITPMGILMGASIGWSNLAYVLGILEGEVMRVLLLFYLAPLWTVPLARLILHERLDRSGFIIMALAFVGAMVMLWHPALGVPWPASRAEWFGVAAGFLFALGNVLVRQQQELGDAAKSIVIWAGVTVAGLVHAPQSSLDFATAWSAGLANAGLIVAIAVALFLMSLALQYGLTRTPANRAIVILLFELVIAAFASYWLAGETLRAQDWVGGALIVAAACWPAGRSTASPPAVGAASPSSDAPPPPS
jgi:drug/metabolite transporter (DMT)-like permease